MLKIALVVFLISFKCGAQDDEDYGWNQTTDGANIQMKPVYKLNATTDETRLWMELNHEWNQTTNISLPPTGPDYIRNQTTDGTKLLTEPDYRFNHTADGVTLPTGPQNTGPQTTNGPTLHTIPGCKLVEDVLRSGGCNRDQFLCHDENRLNESLLAPSEMDRNVFEITSCFCDPTCWKFKDCCVDASTPAELTSEENNIRWGCDLLPGSNERIYVINSCPPGWHDLKEVDLCERRVSKEEYSYVLDIPVFSNSTRRAYSNMYCAKCHKDVNLVSFHINLTCPFGLANCQDFVHQAYYKFGEHSWQIYARGKHFGQYVNFEVFEYFDWEGLKRSYTVRRCQPVIDSCFNYNQYLENCTSFNANYIESADYPRRVYKNIYCSLCNNVSLASSIQCAYSSSYKHLPYLYPSHTYKLQNCTMPDFGMGGYGGGGGYRGGGYGGFGGQGGWPGSGRSSIAALFDFDTRSGTNEVGLKLRCKPGDISVPFTEECIPFKQSKKFIKAGSECLYKGTNNTQRHLQPHRWLHIAKEAITVFRENDSIYINKTRLVYESGEYEEYDNKTYLVCHPWDLYEPKISIVQSRISHVLTFVSLICLAIHILIYASIAKLRNLPGKNLMSLSISLFMAQCLYIFDFSLPNGYPIGCKTIAIITHFWSLTPFFWMNVMAFDIYRTFAHGFSQSSISHHKKTFWCFSAYAWLTPSLITVMALITDYTGVLPSIRPDYGTHTCWLNSQGLLFFFSIPLTLLLSTNIIFFMLTAYSIHQTTKIKVQTKKYQVRFFLYMKLALIMGLPWVLEYISAVVDSELLEYVIIILNHGQGIFIFIAFSLKKKVIGLIIDCLTGKSPTSHDSNSKHKLTKYFTSCIRTSSDKNSPLPSTEMLKESSKESSKSTETIITRL